MAGLPALSPLQPSFLQIGPNDEQYDGYPELSIEDWHKQNNMYIEH